MNKRKRLLVMAAGVLAFALGFLSSLRSAPAQQRFDLKVRNDFFAGFGGDREALDRGMKACAEALAADPKNAEALVWHGAGLYFQGGMAFQAGERETGTDRVRRGTTEMSRAVEMDPDNVAVRIPRGAVLLQSTLFMPEGDFTRQLIRQGLDDYLRTSDLQSAYFDKLGTHPRGELMFGIADAQRRLGNDEEAQRWFKRISAEMKGTVYQKRADKWLETKTLAPIEARCSGCHVATERN